LTQGLERVTHMLEVGAPLLLGVLPNDARGLAEVLVPRLGDLLSTPTNVIELPYKVLLAGGLAAAVRTGHYATEEAFREAFFHVAVAVVGDIERWLVSIRSNPVMSVADKRSLAQGVLQNALQLAWGNGMLVAALRDFWYEVDARFQQPTPPPTPPTPSEDDAGDDSDDSFEYEDLTACVRAACVQCGTRVDPKTALFFVERASGVRKFVTCDSNVCRERTRERLATDNSSS
jgi:hypothetical protein